MPGRIEDYALIGDLQTSALVGRDGSLDWLCLPRVDSPAVFAALLGDSRHGRWLLAPADTVTRVERSYRGETLVLDTEFVTDTGRVRVTDVMPIRHRHPSVVRLVTGLRGRVAMRTEMTLRFDYGDTVPWVRRVDQRLLAVAGPNAITLRTPVRLHGADLSHGGEFSVAAGETVGFELTWHESHLPSPHPLQPEQAVRDTEQWWREWMTRCRYEGEYADAVRRSVITLKALTYAPTGGIVAAPTTSLPEQLGGVRNWDYRYCWLRDATFTLLALIYAGFETEAAAWREWLLRAIAGDPARLQIMYGVAGERWLAEHEAPWLPGYQGSQPVRIGNAAVNQLQLDVYGEVLDALHVARGAGMQAGDAAAPAAGGGADGSWPLQVALMDWLEGNWRQPDEGIWEVRGPRRDFVHSKVMVWVAADRALAGVRQYGLPGPVRRWEQLREQVHAEVCARGFDTGRNSFTQYYGSAELDASLLLIPLVGFLPPDDPRVVGTLAAVERELLSDGFVRRYDTRAAAGAGGGAVDGLAGTEGAFLACTFWLADNHALAGRYHQAREIFERLLALRNDVGLLAEEWDPHGQRMLGNFPQAFSHVPLVNTARHLQRVRPEHLAMHRHSRQHEPS